MMQIKQINKQRQYNDMKIIIPNSSMEINYFNNYIKLNL